MGAEEERQAESNRRKRVQLINQIKEQFDRDERMRQIEYQNSINFLNNQIYEINSNPYYDNYSKSKLTQSFKNIKQTHKNYYYQEKKRYDDMNSEIEENIRYILYEEAKNEKNAKLYAKKIIKKCVSTLLGFAPVISNAKGMIECISGKDYITDEELSKLDRAYSGVSSLPVIGDIISWENWITKILKKLFNI